MAAEHVTPCAHYIALSGSERRPWLEIVPVIAVRDEAHPRAVGLFSLSQPEIPGYLPDLVLRHASEREHEPAELFLGERIEEIGLVLRLVKRLVEGEQAGLAVPIDARVMPGR